MGAALGAAAGNTTYATLSALGLSSVFARVPIAFLSLKIAGAVYLAWLGAKSLWAAWRRDPARLPGGLERGGVGRADMNGGPCVEQGTRAADVTVLPQDAVITGFAQGFANNLVNPAIATFYLVAVPSFLSDPTTLSSRYVLYAVLHITMAFIYHSGWVGALHAMRAFWAKPNARRGLETLTGFALLALAARVAL
jgi:threonine/homoserine/homoserine lactone efflux protein